jgi:hypothetical protein
MLSTVRSLVRSAAILAIGMLGAFAFFGLLLGLIWGLPVEPTGSYQLITLLFVTGFSFIAGGFFSGMLAAGKRIQHGLALGLIFGLCSFGYILGVSTWVPIAALAAGLLGGTGGWVAYSIREGN